MSTEQKTTEQKIEERLKVLDWEIEDAKRGLAKAAEAMLRRATEAVYQNEALLADKPCSTMWVNFAEGDLREARDAKAKLESLIEKKKLLTFIQG